MPLPIALPGDSPLIQVCFNQAWLPYILGCLTQLTLNTTWQAATQDDLNNILAQSNNLILIFQKAFETCTISNFGSSGAEDGFMLRQNPDNPCELQTSVDGVTWCTWADLSKCQPQVTQPGAGSPQPTPGGGCQTYHVVLPANGTWLLPAPINTGDTILVERAVGAWNDGTFGWSCPDGSNYFAGACTGGGGTLSGDPAPALPHMQLIAHLKSGAYFGVLAGLVTIPSGSVFDQLEFQANDALLGDNQGSIEFDVTICNNQAASWTRTLDFRTSDHGFRAAHRASDPATPLAAYVPGVGWQSTAGASSQGFFDELRIWKTGLPSSTYVSAQGIYTSPVVVDEFAAGPGSDLAFTIKINLTPLASGTNIVALGSASPPYTDTSLRIDLVDSTGSTGHTFTLQQITLTGTGTPPF